MDEGMLAIGCGSVNVRSLSVSILSSRVAAETDEVIRDAVTRYFGRSDWKMEDLQGRAVINRFPIGSEVFCIDGAVLVELSPITVDIEEKRGNLVLTANRSCRMLDIPNSINHEKY